MKHLLAGRAAAIKPRINRILSDFIVNLRTENTSPGQIHPRKIFCARRMNLNSEVGVWETC